jgi:predicted nucleic acid-binding protein
MSVIVDTSVWIDHFRYNNRTLVDLMLRDSVLVHPMVIVEIACGTPPAPRNQSLENLAQLQACKQATLAEVLALVEREKLYGLGCGLVDMCLLASTLITPAATLWTLDKRLADVAQRFGVAHNPVMH